MLKMLNNIHEYNEEEFLHILRMTIDAPEEDVDVISNFFDEKILHPDHEDLLFYPKTCGIEDSPEGIINELKRWYAEQGLPLFKDQ